MQIFRLPFTHQTPPAVARRLVKRALAGWNLHRHDEDLLLVTTELVQNAIEHTHNGGELCLSLTDDAIMIEVADDDPTLPEASVPDLRSARGRGLMLVGALARRWGTRPRLPRGKVVWAELALAL
jgi:anti-sigma regulatory factor (Ser/Thr protein kinase)